MDELTKWQLAQNERITILAEECAEVQQIICKALRHGMFSHSPLDKSDEPPNNREILEKELGDLMFAVEQVVLHCDVSESAIIEHCASKMLRIAPYLHYTEPKQRPPTPSLTDARLVEAGAKNHKCDTDELVCFYEQEFYPLSNFSAFRMRWDGLMFDTSEAVYHWEKFRGKPDIQYRIKNAVSAHEAFKIAQRFKDEMRPDWNDVKLDVMRSIIRAKHDQHEYVRKKLYESGTRRLVEDSWRDSFWGWGEDRQGENWLGRLWMELRDEVQTARQALGEVV